MYKAFDKTLSNTTFNVIGEPIKFIDSELSSELTLYSSAWKTIDGDYESCAQTESRQADRYWQGEFNVTSTVDYVTLSQGRSNPNFGNIYMNIYMVHVVCVLVYKSMLGYNYTIRYIAVINGLPKVIDWARRSVAIG